MTLYNPGSTNGLALARLCQSALVTAMVIKDRGVVKNGLKTA